MHLRTKRLGIGGVVAGGLMLGAAALVIGAGLARADSSKGHEGDMSVPALIAEEAPYGANLTPEGAMRVALNICGGHAMGYTRDQISPPPCGHRPPSTRCGGDGCGVPLLPAVRLAAPAGRDTSGPERASDRERMGTGAPDDPGARELPDQARQRRAQEVTSYDYCRVCHYPLDDHSLRAFAACLWALIRRSR